MTWNIPGGLLKAERRPAAIDTVKLAQAAAEMLDAALPRRPPEIKFCQ